MLAALFVAMYKPYSFRKLNSGDEQQKIVLRNHYSCLSEDLNLLVLLYTVETVLEISIEFVTLTLVIYFASVCVQTTHVLSIFNHHLLTLDDSKQLDKGSAIEQWKTKIVQLISIIDNVDVCVSPFSCVVTCAATYGMLGAIYAITMFCDGSTTIYKMNQVMRALLPLGSLMMCAVTVDWQVRKFSEKNLPCPSFHQRPFMVVLLELL